MTINYTQRFFFLIPVCPRRFSKLGSRKTGSKVIINNSIRDHIHRTTRAFLRIPFVIEMVRGGGPRNPAEDQILSEAETFRRFTEAVAIKALDIT